ncbi:MAG: leucyl/phenylalanyl-tRNA--protein transferase [Campylobacteraceae bacterium]|nr:leucyl/phenylalanyl-tRNA--protein transferase [Campylobacteraceae bacterium]
MVFLDDKKEFPSPCLAPTNKPLAIGGDLSLERLGRAYKEGIFPWFEEGGPILWWSPDPRCVLFPESLHVNRTLRRFARRYDVKFNSDFDDVVALCMAREKTWITTEMSQAYGNLHKAKKAFCVSVYEKEELVGGVYGVCVGRVFCGESMFSLRPNASKVALWALCTKYNKGLVFIDCQVPNPHLFRIGATLISRKEYLTVLEKVRYLPCAVGEKS